MQNQIVAAIFDSVPKAERAIAELRDTGVSDEAISVVTVRHGDDEAATANGHLKDHLGEGRGAGVGKGVAAGGAVGLIAGLALLVIPGLGPIAAAGAIGQAFGTAGSALLVGAAAGGLTGALVDYGMDRKEAEAFERRIREGATLVTVETGGSESNFASARAILRAAGGETARSESEAEA